MISGAARRVAFLDPFGMQVPWATIEGIARRTELEVILNFPMYMATQRLVKKGATFSAAERAKLDAWFGDPGWYAVAFDDRPGLFWPVTTKVAGSSGALVDWYCERMRNFFKWVEVSRPILNSRGTPLYHLIHATHDDRGHDIAKYVLNMALREEARPRRRTRKQGDPRQPRGRCDRAHAGKPGGIRGGAVSRRVAMSSANRPAS